MLGNPNASEAEIYRVTRAALNESAGLLDEIIKSWFERAYRSFRVESEGYSTTIVSTSKTAQTTRSVGIKIKEAIKSTLMDHVLSNGKALRFATFGDCATEGGWLSAIARHGKAHEVVGKRLTESDLQTLFKRFVSTKKVA